MAAAKITPSPLTLTLADFVDFAVDAGAVDDETGDETSFTATIRGLEFNPTPSTVVADSSEDWPDSEVQGIDGWTFGYYQPLNDSDGVYQSTNMVEFPSEFYTGRKWDVPGGNPPYTEISKSTARPNGVEDGADAEWAVRRWTSDYSGRVDVEWSFSKSRNGGDGATGRVFLNGEEIDSILVEGTDRTGQTKTISVPEIRVGDHLDFVVDPLGVGGDPAAPDGDDDLSKFTTIVTRFADIEAAYTTNIHSDAFDVGSSVYLRMPFSIEDPTVVTALDLNLMYDDGFIAYINGKPVAASNVPDTLAFDSTAIESSRSDSGYGIRKFRHCEWT